MTLLRDMRLLLIVGLAILCLLALRLCSSEYQPDTIGSVTKTETAVTDSTSSSDTQTDTQGIVSSAKSDQSGDAANISEESEEVSDSDTAAESTDSVEQQPTQEEPLNATAETGGDTGVSVEEQSAETGVEDTVAAEATEREAADTESGNNDQSTLDESSNAADSSGDLSESPIVESVSVPVEVVPSAIGEFTPSEVKRIVINAPAESGALITDMKSDIDAMKDGVQQYNEKLELIESLIDKVKNPAN